jgi:hypothetical protein
VAGPHYLVFKNTNLDRPIWGLKWGMAGGWWTKEPLTQGQKEDMQTFPTISCTLGWDYVVQTALCFMTCFQLVMEDPKFDSHFKGSCLDALPLYSSSHWWSGDRTSKIEMGDKISLELREVSIRVTILLCTFWWMTSLRITGQFKGTQPVWDKGKRGGYGDCQSLICTNAQPALPRGSFPSIYKCSPVSFSQCK